MIVPMTKYNLVLHHASYEAFLERLREFGMVDITTTGWEPDDADRALIASIEQCRQAIARLEVMAAAPDFEAVEPFGTGTETMAQYRRIMANVDSLTGQLEHTGKEMAELRVWGGFSQQTVQELLAAGVELRYFSALDDEFNTNAPAWSERYHIERIASEGGTTYFVVITRPLADIELNANELRLPAAGYADKERQAARLQEQITAFEHELGRCASSLDRLRAEVAAQTDRLDLQRVMNSAGSGAEGKLMILEGWATRESAEKVDAFIDAQPGLVYLRSNPTPEDDTPVLLKNGRFSRLFEFVGGFYSLPKYGTMDLTPYFAPFYMIFFAFCLGDAGYGLVLLLAGILLKIKKAKGTMGQIAGLTIWCGGATVLFGLLTGSFFGIQLREVAVFSRFSAHMLSSDDLFYLALAMGVVQIIFGMLLKIIATTRQFGFKYALGTLGWMTVILSTLVAMFVCDMDFGRVTASVTYLATMGAGVFLMLFMNSPGKNPLVNFGSGLWNTYNDVTGLLGDVLSYIRLFALGLTGGILAMVFNDLAFGMAPDIPVVMQLVVFFILLLGHCINLFMSVLGSFVHPMRLTFVEFYKNAGFEGTMRSFNPFRKNQN